MLFHTYAEQLNDVLLAFFLWLSALVCLIALAVLVVLGVSLFKLMKEPATTRRFLL
jgi:heme exporter protein D